MKGKQYSVKVYETTIENIEDEEKFISFFDTNYTLFKNRLIVIQGKLSHKVEKFLADKSLKYIHNIELPTSHTRQVTEVELNETKAQDEKKQAEIEEEMSKLSDRLHNNLKVFDGMVRSGQELNIDGDLLLLNRVNSGATINTTGNLIITRVVEGSIRCNGNFMMLSNSPKANIIFHGVQVDNDLLEEKLNRIELKDNKILITPVLKKEINWAS
ncbi:MAG: septum site-determining protein MinC [Campylobacterota bacterium]|nr:septum site-determining protein MinC [Campylobacterota bacterium]